MSLELQHRWEHALLAATIEAATEHCPDCPLGRTAIQKLLYFIKVLDVPMRYQFDIHHYGPYSQDIPNDIEWLLADNVVEDRSDTARTSDYKPSKTIEELKQLFGEKLIQHRATIGAVCEAMSDMSPANLELISTLDFSYRWVRAAGGDGPWKSKTVDKFRSIKKNKFDDEQIEYWYSKLSGARLISA